MSQPLIETGYCAACNKSWDLKDSFRLDRCPYCGFNEIDVGTRVPLRRHMQLVLRIMGDEPVEVTRDITPTWTAEAVDRMPRPSSPFEDVDVQSEMAKILAEEVHREAAGVLEGMLRELLSKVTP